LQIFENFASYINEEQDGIIPVLEPSSSILQWLP